MIAFELPTQLNVTLPDDKVATCDANVIVGETNTFVIATS